MKKTVIFMMFFTLVSKLLGFLRDVILAYVYGASRITDIFLISQTLPGVVFSFVSAGFFTGYIPMYTKIKEKEGSKRALKYTNNLLNILFLFCILLTGIVLLITPLIVNLLVSGFDDESFYLTVKFSRITIFSIFFTSIITIFSGFLQVNNNYMIPALLGLPLNIVSILVINISKESDVILLAIGVILSGVAQVLMLFPFVLKLGYKYQLLIDFKDPYIKEMLFLSVPLIIGISITQINTLIDRTIASQLAEGAVSTLNYANKVNLFIQGVFVTSINIALYPLISKMIIQKNMIQLKSCINNLIIKISITIIPLSIFFIIFSKTIVRLLFGYGAFSESDIVNTSNALVCYSIGMLSFGIKDIFIRVFYSLQNTRVPMYNSIFSMILNIILNLILGKQIGVSGLALATSISSIVSTIMLIFSLRRVVGKLDLKYTLNKMFQIFFVSILIGIISYIFFQIGEYFGGNNVIILVLVTVTGVITYAISIILFKIIDFSTIKIFFRKLVYKFK